MKENTRADGMPLYHRVYLLLRNDILTGQYEGGEALPGENSLAEKYGVSRVTIRRAMEKLYAEDLIRRVRGSGTFVRPSVHSAPITASLSHFFEHAEWLAGNTAVKLLKLEYIPAPALIAEALEVAPRTVVQHSVRLRSLDGQPFMVLDTYLPEWAASRYDIAELESSSLHLALRRGGVRFAAADYAVTAVAADAEMAAHLQVPVAAPLLCIAWTQRDVSGRVAEYLTTYARPDLYVLRTSFREAQAEPAR